ncbi:MAG: LamG-like jellyroll fold domain-containing protein, partial [Candidatus Dojkabacteria bacterium]
MIKRIEQYKVFLILFSLLLLTTIISTYNPFKISLLAADNIPACISTCTDYTGNYYGDCERFCDPYSSGYYGYENSCAYQSYPEGNTEQWCSYVEMDVEMCIGGCIAENPDATDVEYNCRSLCSAYNDKYGCENNYGAYLQGGYDFTPSTSFCSYLDFRDEVGSCYTACTTELGAGYDMDCSTFCNPYDYGYYGYDEGFGSNGGCAQASQAYGHNYPQPGLWCSHLETNTQMCIGACTTQNSLSDYPDSNCNSVCTSYTTTSECVTNTEGYFETGFTPTTDFCSYLEYGKIIEESLTFTNTTRGVLTVTTPGTDNVTGTVITGSTPDTIDLSDGDGFTQSCTYQEVAANTWDFTCSTLNLPREGVYLYYITATMLDYSVYNDGLYIDNTTIPTYLWSFDNDTNWEDEDNNGLDCNLVGGHAIQSENTYYGFGKSADLTYPDPVQGITYNDTGGLFAFSQADSHFKVEALVYGTDFNVGDRPVVARKTAGGKNSWLLSTNGLGGGGIYCAIWFDDESSLHLGGGDGLVTTNTWNKIACEWDTTSSTLRAYINEIEVNSSVYNGTGSIVPNDGPLMINGYPPDGWGGNKILVDEVKITDLTGVTPPAQAEIVTDPFQTTIYQDDNLIDGTIGGNAVIDTVHISKAGENNWTLCNLYQGDPYDFSCPINDVLTDLQTYAFDIKTTDTSSNETFALVQLETDFDGGLDLQAMWTFDVDPKEKDNIGNRTADYHNMGWDENGKIRYAANSTNGYLSLNDNDGNFSFDGDSAHFKTEAMVFSSDFTSEANHYSRIIAKNNSEDNENSWAMGIDHEGGLYCAVWVNGDQKDVITGPSAKLTNNQWNKIACEWNGREHTLKAYIGDILVDEIDAGGTISASADSVGIGARPTGDANFQGLIDNLKVYSETLQSNTPPSININDSFTLKKDLLSTPINGRVMSTNIVSNVEISRIDNESWNSCNITPLTTGESIPTPIMAFSMDETSGSLVDSSTTEFEGNPINATPTGGIVGNARSFTGDYGMIEVWDGSRLLPQGSGARTIAGWVKLNRFQQWISHVFHYGNSEENQSWGLAIYDDGTFGPHLWGIHPSAGNVPLNQWVHLAITLDDEGQMTYYQNGIQVGTNTAIPNTGTGLPRVGTSTGVGEYLNGSVDELYMFDSELTAAQIENVYKKGLNIYDFTCWTGPLADLSTNTYQIRGIDELNNVTAVENFGYAEVEADDFGGLQLRTLLRLERNNSHIDTIGTLTNWFAYSGETNPIESIHTTTGLYGDAGDFQDMSRLFFQDNGTSRFDFNDYEDKLVHFRTEASVKRVQGDVARSIVVKTLSEAGEPQWKVGTSDVTNLLCSVVTLGGTVSVVSDEIIPVDQWRTVGCDWNALTGELTASIDGTNVKTVTTDIDISLRQFAPSTGPLVIGGMGQDSYYEPFNEYIDNVKIYSEYLTIPEPPVILNNTSVLATSGTYILQGTVNTNTSDNIAQIQYREYVQGQGENLNWKECTCNLAPCDSPTEEFSCSITNIPESSTTTYEIRYGYGDPASYLANNSYGIFDITRDSTNSLEVWWSFDKAEELIDYSANLPNGTLDGIGTLSSNLTTGSITKVFDGNTHFEVQDTSGLLNFNSESSQFTVDMWLKPEIGLNINTDYFIISKNAAESSIVWGIKIHVTAEGNYNVRGILNTGGEIKEVGYNDTKAFLTAGEWNHVLFSFANLDSTATIKVNDNSPSVYDNGKYFSLPASSSSITVGALASGGDKFKGEIGDIKIFSITDARAPQITFTELSDPERITNDPNQEFEITITDQTGVQSFGYFFFNMSGSWDIPEPDFIHIADREWIYVDNPTEGNWGDKEVVIRINAVNLSDTIWYLYTRAKDTNGFESLFPGHWWYTSYYTSSPSAMPYYQFYVEAQDTTPPQIFAHSIIPSETVDTNPGVRGYVKDNPIDTISAIASIEYKLEKGIGKDESWVSGEIGTWNPIIPLGIENIFDQPTEEFYLRLEGLTQGDYKLEIRAADASGNSTEDNDTNRIEYFTIYEINPKPDTTVLVKEEDFNSHTYHDQLFSDGVWGNGILRLRQAVNFQQEQVVFTNNNDFGYEYGEYRGKSSDSVDGNLWISNNDRTFMYYNIDNNTYTRYPKLPRDVEPGKINEFEYDGKRYLVLGNTYIYDINNTPEDISDDTYVDYADKTGFENHNEFMFVDVDTRNNKLAIFARADADSGEFIIWIDTKKTVMDLSDDTYVTWGVADNLFYNERKSEYHTIPDMVGLLLDQELNIFIASSYTGGTWICSDGGDPENKANDSCRYYDSWGKFSIIKDYNGYYWLGGVGRLVRIDSKNTPSILDDTMTDVISQNDPIVQEDTVTDMVIIPGTYPVGDELWFMTSNGYLRGIEYNFTPDDDLDDTHYVYKIPTHLNRSGSGAFFSLRGDDTLYIVSQAQGVQKITLTRSFESLNTIEMLPIPPDGILAINYIDLEEVLGAVTNGSQYTLNDLVTYEVSNDSGVTWFPITQGQRVNFPTPDYKLKLKIILRSGSSPIIDALKLSYVAYPEKKDDQCDIKINDKAPQITSIKPNTNKSFTVNFATLADPTVQSYTLEYGLSNSNFTTGSQTVLKDTNTFTVTGIQEDTEYFFRVKAVSDCTSSLWSNVMSATNTGEATQPPVKPHRPPKATDPTTEENLCGNGVLDEGEECDYANTETYMCEDGSTGICTVECTLDVNSCKEEDSDIPIIDRIKENIKEIEKDRDGEAISATQVANWAVKLISLSLLTLSVPLIPYYFMRILLGIPYIIGMRKRDKEYGYVYDSITKEPIKQAIVRIYSGDKLVHTDVTGTYGEFGGNIKADVYTLSVQKPQYTFPSTMVVGSTDMHISNVY